MIEIVKEEEKRQAILVGLQIRQEDDEFDNAMAELSGLAITCDIEPLMEINQRADSPVQSTYVGSGKLEEIKNAVSMLDADMVVFDQTLSPMQFRNLNRELGVEVMDRTGLILRIFAEQARTREARLQVEHARLKYIMPRLAGMWTHFGRQGGSSGSKSNRGVGETQIELDRRHIERRLSELEKELKLIAKERKTQREKRLGSGIPRVALVGYTNAGKSTIMNRMLELNPNPDDSKRVLAQDKLFATLDTTVRKIAPKGKKPILLSDTVGFINELPHTLVKAFRSTLEEACYADLLIQVVDYSAANHRECMEVTDATLRDIGALGIPMIYVYNKSDLIEDLPFSLPQVREDSIYMSAASGIGVMQLWDLIEKKLRSGTVICDFLIPYSRGAALNEIINSSEVISTEYVDEGSLICVRCREGLRNKYLEYLYKQGQEA